MRSIFIATAAILALASPVLADDASDLAAAKTAITAANLSPASDLNIWCGAAMTLFSQAMKDSDPANSKAAEANAGVLFGKAAPLLTADGVKQEDMGALSADYMTVAAAQLVTQTEKPTHTQEECQAAAEAN